MENSEKEKKLEKAKGSTIGKLIMGKPKLMAMYVKLYRSLCQQCKAEVQQKPDMEIEAYCDSCQNKCVKYMTKVRKRIR